MFVNPNYTERVWRIFYIPSVLRYNIYLHLGTRGTDKATMFANLFTKTTLQGVGRKIAHDKPSFTTDMFVESGIQRPDEQWKQPRNASHVFEYCHLKN